MYSPSKPPKSPLSQPNFTKNETIPVTTYKSEGNESSLSPTCVSLSHRYQIPQSRTSKGNTSITLLSEGSPYCRNHPNKPTGTNDAILSIYNSRGASASREVISPYEQFKSPLVVNDVQHPQVKTDRIQISSRWGIPPSFREREGSRESTCDKAKSNDSTIVSTIVRTNDDFHGAINPTTPTMCDEGEIRLNTEINLSILNRSSPVTSETGRRLRFRLSTPVPRSPSMVSRDYGIQPSSYSYDRQYNDNVDADRHNGLDDTVISTLSSSYSQYNENPDTIKSQLPTPNCVSSRGHEYLCQDHKRRRGSYSPPRTFSGIISESGAVRRKRKHGSVGDNAAYDLDTEGSPNGDGWSHSVYSRQSNHRECLSTESRIPNIYLEPSHSNKCLPSNESDAQQTNDNNAQDNECMKSTKTPYIQSCLPCSILVLFFTIIALIICSLAVAFDEWYIFDSLPSKMFTPYIYDGNGHVVSENTATIKETTSEGITGSTTINSVYNRKAVMYNLSLMVQSKFYVSSSKTSPKTNSNEGKTLSPKMDAWFRSLPTGLEPFSVKLGLNKVCYSILLPSGLFKKCKERKSVTPDGRFGDVEDTTGFPIEQIPLVPDILKKRLLEELLAPRAALAEEIMKLPSNLFESVEEERSKAAKETALQSIKDTLSNLLKRDIKVIDYYCAALYDYITVATFHNPLLFVGFKKVEDVTDDKHLIPPCKRSPETVRNMYISSYSALILTCITLFLAIVIFAVHLKCSFDLAIGETKSCFGRTRFMRVSIVILVISLLCCTVVVAIPLIMDETYLMCGGDGNTLSGGDDLKNRGSIRDFFFQSLVASFSLMVDFNDYFAISSMKWANAIRELSPEAVSVLVTKGDWLVYDNLSKTITSKGLTPSHSSRRELREPLHVATTWRNNFNAIPSDTYDVQDKYSTHSIIDHSLSIGAAAFMRIKDAYSNSQLPLSERKMQPTTPTLLTAFPENLTHVGTHSFGVSAFCIFSALSFIFIAVVALAFYTWNYITVERKTVKSDKYGIIESPTIQETRNSNSDRHSHSIDEDRGTGGHETPMANFSPSLSRNEVLSNSSAISRSAVSQPHRFAFRGTSPIQTHANLGYISPARFQLTRSPPVAVASCNGSVIIEIPNHTSKRYNSMEETRQMQVGDAKGEVNDGRKLSPISYDRRLDSGVNSPCVRVPVKSYNENREDASDSGAHETNETKEGDSQSSLSDEGLSATQSPKDQFTHIYQERVIQHSKLDTGVIDVCKKSDIDTGPGVQQNGSVPISYHQSKSHPESYTSIHILVEAIEKEESRNRLKLMKQCEIDCTHTYLPLMRDRLFTAVQTEFLDIHCSFLVDFARPLLDIQIEESRKRQDLKRMYYYKILMWVEWCREYVAESMQLSLSDFEEDTNTNERVSLKLLLQFWKSECESQMLAAGIKLHSTDQDLCLLEMPNIMYKPVKSPKFTSAKSDIHIPTKGYATYNASGADRIMTSELKEYAVGGSQQHMVEHRVVPSIIPDTNIQRSYRAGIREVDYQHIRSIKESASGVYDYDSLLSPKRQGKKAIKYGEYEIMKSCTEDSNMKRADSLKEEYQELIRKCDADCTLRDNYPRITDTKNIIPASGVSINVAPHPISISLSSSVPTPSLSPGRHTTTLLLSPHRVGGHLDTELTPSACGVTSHNVSTIASKSESAGYPKENRVQLSIQCNFSGLNRSVDDLLHNASGAPLHSSPSINIMDRSIRSWGADTVINRLVRLRSSSAASVSRSRRIDR